MTVTDAEIEHPEDSQLSPEDVSDLLKQLSGSGIGAGTQPLQLVWTGRCIVAAEFCSELEKAAKNGAEFAQQPSNFGPFAALITIIEKKNGQKKFFFEIPGLNTIRVMKEAPVEEKPELEVVRNIDGLVIPGA